MIPRLTAQCCIPALCVCARQVVVDAVLAIQKGPKVPIDLHMVEIMEMMHKTDTDTRSVVTGCRWGMGCIPDGYSSQLVHTYYVTAAVLHCCCITECAESIGEIPETAACPQAAAHCYSPTLQHGANL